VIATAKASNAYVALALAIVVLIDVMSIWLPLGFYLADATARTVKAVNAWLQARSRVVTVVLLAVAGLALIGNGIYGLAT
jgi:fumarate reductase subunit D